MLTNKLCDGIALVEQSAEQNQIGQTEHATLGKQGDAEVPPLHRYILPMVKFN